MKKESLLALIGIGIFGLLSEGNIAKQSTENELRFLNIVRQVQNKFYPELRERKIEVHEKDIKPRLAEIDYAGKINLDTGTSAYDDTILTWIAGHELSHVALGHNNPKGLEMPKTESQLEAEANTETKKRIGRIFEANRINEYDYKILNALQGED